MCTCVCVVWYGGMYECCGGDSIYVCMSVYVCVCCGGGGVYICVCCGGGSLYVCMSMCVHMCMCA